MFPRKHTISGKELISKWSTDIHELSYLTLKHGITVLDSSILPKIKFSFNPADYKIDFGKVLDTIRNDPTRLNRMLFWLPELERLEIEKEISSLKSKASSKSPALTPDSGVRYSRKYSENIRFRRAKPEEQKSDTIKSKKTIMNVIDDQQDEIRQHSNVFSLIGKIWFIKFKQQEWGLFPDHQKYKYKNYCLIWYSRQVSCP